MTKLHKYKISVVIPTYNRAHTLKRALASVGSQTYPAYEVVVVDDCSTDGTESLVRKFSGIKYLRTQQNSGAGGARNLGVAEARGDWIAFLDSDDIWVCNRLEEQVRYLERDTAESADLVCAGITVQERSGNCAYYGFPFEEPPRGWTFNEFQTYPFSTPTWLIKKATFTDLGGFDASLPNCEDLDFLAKLLKIAAIVVLRAPLVIKYNQADSIDADLERIEYSYQVLFDRHAGLWEVSAAAAANSYFRLGGLRVRSGQISEARAAFAKAIKWKPLRVKYWVAWLAPYGSTVFSRYLRKLLFWK